VASGVTGTCAWRRILFSVNKAAQDVLVTPKGVQALFESTGQRCQAVMDEALGHLDEWIAQQIKDGVSTKIISQTLLA
jgi:hypothetical protein